MTSRRFWSPLRMVKFLVERVLVDPVRDGRLRNNGWPAGLNAIVAVSLIVYSLLLVATVSASHLRANLELTRLPQHQTVPLAITPVVLVLIVFVVALLYTAVLHMTAWVKIPVVLLTMATVLTACGNTDVYSAAWWAAVGAAALLACFALMRWFQAFAWGEFVVALVVIGHGLIIPVWLQSSSLPPAIQPLVTWLAVNDVYLVLFHLSIPVTLLAGAAMAELTARTVAWTVTTLAEGLDVRHQRHWIAGGVGLIACYGAFVWSLLTEVVDTRPDNSPQALVAGAVVGIMTMLLCAVMAWRADTIPTGDRPVRPDPDDIPEAWANVAPVMALILASSVVGWGLVGVLLKPFDIPLPEGSAVSTVKQWFTYLSVAVVVVWAWHLASKGRRIIPMGLMSFAVVMTIDNIYVQWQIPATYSGLLIVVLVLAIAVGLWLVATATMTTDRGMALAVVCLLGAAFPYREVIFEPLTAVMGLFGVSSALLVGLLWRLLTDNNFTRGDSFRFPRSGRVLIALAGAVVAALAVALDMMMGGNWVGDLMPFEGAGDRYLGVSLMIVVMFAGLSLAARGRVVRGHEHQVPDLELEGNAYPAPPDTAAPVELLGD